MAFRPRSLVFPLLLVAILAALAIPKIRELSQKKDKAPKAGPGGGGGRGGAGGGAPTPVSVTVVQPGKLENKIQATGTVLPEEQVQLSSEISGLVTRINFTEGSRVRSGQVLVQLEAAELQAQLRRLEAQQQLNRQTESRTKALLDKEFISRQEYDQVMTNVQATEADLARARAQLAKATIRAPFDGIIGLKNISKGAFLTPGTVIANLIKVQPVKLDFSVPAKYTNAIKTGDVVRFSIEGADTTFTARVYALEPGIDPGTRTLQVRARYENRQEQVKPGSFVRIEVPLSATTTALTVPSEAIVPVASGQQLFLLKGGKASPQPVEIGQRTEDRVEVLKGIAAGDTIITTGVMQLRPGSKVEITQIQ